MVTLDVVRELFAELPGVEEGHSYGTPAFRVCKKLLARVHQKEDALVIKSDFGERERLMQANPLTYYITDHYLKHPLVLVRFPTVKREELREVLVKAWQREASKSLIDEFESRL